MPAGAVPHVGYQEEHHTVWAVVTPSSFSSDALIPGTADKHLALDRTFDNLLTILGGARVLSGSKLLKLIHLLLPYFNWLR